MNQHTSEMLARLSRHVTYADALALRRIAMTLHRWAELECGDDRGNCIERDEVTGKPFMTFDPGHGARRRYAIPDRERGAQRRLAAIMKRYPGLVAYEQGDPRGAPLYILTRDDVRGHDIASVYNRGMAVHS